MIMDFNTHDHVDYLRVDQSEPFMHSQIWVETVKLNNSLKEESTLHSTLLCERMSPY